MDCGIPFCHNGCPLGNLIPEWNDLVYRDRWRDAIERLHATNNFPEFTGRLCPAPCEASCVLGINQDPVTIKQVEVEIIDNAFDEGWVRPDAAARRHRQDGGRRRLRAGRAGRRPAADPGRPRCHRLRAGRPHRRAAALRHPRVQDGEAPHRPPAGPDGGRGHHVPRRASTSASTSPREQLRADFDAVVLAGGATAARDLPIPGRQLDGIHQAMEYLPWANKVQQGDPVLDDDGQPPITAKGKNGHHHRRRRHRRRLPGHRAPPGRAPACTSSRSCRGRRRARADSTPWPTYPLMFRVSSAHEEGGERVFSVNTEKFVGHDGKVTGLRAHEVMMKDGKFEKVDGIRLRTRRRPGAAGDGLRRPGAAGPADRPGRGARRARQRRPRRRLRHLGARVSSWPATWAAASR